MMQQNNVPNVYQLAGDGIRITYIVSNNNGEAQLDYQDAQGSRTFTGNQVRSEESSLGMLLTVLLAGVADGNVVTLTLLVPRINMAGKDQQSFETLAILTTNRGSFTGPPPGADQIYRVYHFQGTAQLTTAMGAVTLSVDSTTYQVGDPIVATLSNQGIGTIYFPDHLTNCTVIQLQRQVNGNWEEVNPCLLEIVTLQHHLDAGQRLDVELQSATNSAGSYRAALTYQLRESGGPLVAIHSPEFVVG